MPEVLWFKINGEVTTQVPVRVEGGRVSPGRLHVQVFGNTGWRLTVSASPLEGPLTLPPERLRLGGRELSSLEREVLRGKGAQVFDLDLTIQLLPGEPGGVYEGTLTFELYKL